MGFSQPLAPRQFIYKQGTCVHWTSFVFTCLTFIANSFADSTLIYFWKLAIAIRYCLGGMIYQGTLLLLAEG